MKQAFTTLSLLASLSLSTTHAQNLTNQGATISLTGGATLFVGGSLTNNSGTLDLSNGANQLTVGGNLVNASGATLTPGSASTVTLTGPAAQQLNLQGATLANLTISNTSSGGVSLPAGSNASVAGTLTLASGLVTTAPSTTLVLLNGATLSGEQSGRYVKGNLAAVKANLPAGATTAFPNGFALTPTMALTNLTVTRRAGLNVAQVSYGTSASGNTGIDRIWGTSAPVAGQVGLTWLSDDDKGRTANLAQTQVWARSAAPVAGSDWTRISGTQNGTARSASGTTPTSSSFSFFTVGTADAPLPVTLVAFTAERQDADALLRWTTASELDNAYFEVESAVDGAHFQRLGRVGGAGTSSQAHDYQFTDPVLARYGAGVVYYRLRQVDNSGQSTYSPVRQVLVPTATGWLVQAYPNPSPAATTLTVLVQTQQGGPVQLTLTDAVGRLLSQQTAQLAPGTSSLPLAAGADLAAGVYVLQVQQGTQQQTLKLVRQ